MLIADIDSDVIVVTAVVVKINKIACPKSAKKKSDYLNDHIQIPNESFQQLCIGTISFIHSTRTRISIRFVAQSQNLSRMKI